MKSNKILSIKNLSYEIDGNPVLKDVNFDIDFGSKTLLMGPNGVGKSSLVNAIIGAREDAVVEGYIFINGIDSSNLSVDEIAKLGVFIGFQNPPQIPGVSYLDLLYEAYKNKELENPQSRKDFKRYVESIMDDLGVNKTLLNKSVNENLSGGEKKKMELLQMVVNKPKLAILDEPDSGLDLDSSKIVENAIELLQDSAIFLISHDVSKLINMTFDQVLILRCCGFLEKGGDDLIKKISEYGYGKSR